MGSALSFRHLLLGMLIVASPVNAATIEVYALEAMPYCGIEQGQPTGLAVEILQAASRYGAPDFRFRFDVSWLRAQEMVQRPGNELSAIIPFSRTAPRCPLLGGLDQAAAGMPVAEIIAAAGQAGVDLGNFTERLQAAAHTDSNKPL